jgi:hypothetical protein
MNWVESNESCGTVHKLVGEDGQVIGKVEPTHAYMFGRRTEAVSFYDASTMHYGYLGEYMGLEAAKTAVVKKLTGRANG